MISMLLLLVGAVNLLVFINVIKYEDYMAGTLLDQGVMLLVYGMGIVFLFLTVLVMATSFMSWLVIKFAAHEEFQPEIRSSRRTASTPQDDTQLLSVISAAIHHYRKRHKKHK